MQIMNFFNDKSNYKVKKPVKSPQKEVKKPLVNISSSKKRSYKDSDTKIDSEFWDDCKETKGILKEDSTNREDIFTFNKEKLDEKSNNKKKIIDNYKNQIVSDAYLIKENREDNFKKLLEKYPDNSPEKEITTKNSIKATLRCNQLYENGKIKNKVNELINQKNSVIREQKELLECTFKPKTNNINRRKSEQILEQRDIYDRAINWKKRKIEKINQDIYKQRVNEEFPFKPQLSKVPSQLLFKKKSIGNELSSRYFLKRLENARLEHKIKKEILNIRDPTLFSRINNPKSNSILRSASQGDLMNNNIGLDLNSSNIGDAIKNLHYELHNFDINDVD